MSENRDVSPVPMPAGFGRAALAYARFKGLAEAREALSDLAGRAIAESQGTRVTVRADRDRRRDEAEAREQCRAIVREFVQSLKAAGESLDRVLYRTADVMRLLRSSGEIPDEDASLESEVMRWAAEEFCFAA